MMTIFYNLVNRKLRTFLTILGITIGIVALTVMGAMSEKLNNLINGAIDYYNSHIIVQPRTGIPGGIPLGRGHTRHRGTGSPARRHGAGALPVGWRDRSDR